MEAMQTREQGVLYDRLGFRAVFIDLFRTSGFLWSSVTSPIIKLLTAETVEFRSYPKCVPAG
jgi:hypothetical protein